MGITFKNCDSLYCVPVIYIILHSNYTNKNFYSKKNGGAKSFMRDPCLHPNDDTNDICVPEGSGHFCCWLGLKQSIWLAGGGRNIFRRCSWVLVSTFACLPFPCSCFPASQHQWVRVQNLSACLCGKAPRSKSCIQTTYPQNSGEQSL